ncbi:uncharacterized protein VTP21DRAFT_3350 [Calcarisporiella thermophila]|uniref:uncharacterized protein n=1 Tax=Calcarisporiella thermophila TaxID=911321 RepID=UPI0037430E3F
MEDENVMQQGSELHVEYILQAQFDIDKGASLTYQYPSETGMDEHLLAELMLPDGAHMRSEDWTVFFLNQTVPDPDAISSGTNGDKEKKPLLYVLNLVRTKHDASVKRGAIVKAMAICTRHRFLHIYKPVLLLAIEKSFKDASVKVLSDLYEAVNSMDLSQVPSFTWYEKQILRHAENNDLFEEKFNEEPSISNDSRPGIGTTQAGLGIQTSNDITTGAGDEGDDLGRRRPYMSLIADRRNSISRNKDRHFFETKGVYDGIRLPIRVPLTLNPEEVGDFSLIKLISTFSPANLTPSTGVHHPHLDINGPFTHPIIVLINALLTQKRVVFLGHGRPSGEVANYVLAACAMGTGCGTVLRGFTERAFPYTNLLYVDELLKCPGFIAGVTNPTFEDHPSWWDVLCNINTGKILISKDIEMPSQTSRGGDLTGDDSKARGDKGETWGRDKWESPDNEFMANVTVAIQSHFSESAIRAKFQDYIARFVKLAAVYEEETYGSTQVDLATSNMPDASPQLGTGIFFADEATKQRELAINANRIEGWRGTISYKYRQIDFMKSLKTRSIKNLDVARQISKLQVQRNIPDAEVIAIFKSFVDNVVTPKQIVEFLSYLPHYRGGLTPIGFGLFHPSRVVRQHTLDLFNRMNAHPVGVKFLLTLNHYQRFAYERLNTNENAPTSAGTAVEKFDFRGQEDMKTDENGFHG